MFIVIDVTTSGRSLKPQNHGSSPPRCLSEARKPIVWIHLSGLPSRNWPCHRRGKRFWQHEKSARGRTVAICPSHGVRNKISLSSGLEGTKRAISVNVQLPCLRKDPHTGSISRELVNSPSELCRRRIRIFTEVVRVVPPERSLCLQDGLPMPLRACRLGDAGVLHGFMRACP